MTTEGPTEPTPPHQPDDPVDAALVAEHGGEDLTSKAANGFVWALAGFLLIQVGGFVTYSVATHKLGPSGVGVVATFMTIVLFSDVLLDLGMGASLIYEQEEGQSDRVKIAFTVNAATALVGAVAVLVLAPWIAEFFQLERYTWIFRLLAVLVVVKGFNQIPDALLRRQIDFRRRMIADLTRAVGRSAIAIFLLVRGRGPESLIIGTVTSEGLAAVVTWSLVRFRPGVRFDRGVAGEMLRYGLAVFGSRLTGMLWLNGDYLVVSNHYGGNSRQMGDYSAAFKMPELIVGSVYTLFSSVAFPTFSAAREVGPDKLREASLRALRLLTLFGFPVGVGLSLVARDFIPLWFGAKFSGAVLPMEIFGVAAGFAGIGFASGDLYSAVGKPRLGLYFNLVGAPILVGGFLLVVDHGVAAVATVHLAVIVPYSALRIEIANRLVGTTWAQSMRAMQAAISSTVGMLALALPVRLLVGHGAATLVAIVAAGTVGAVGGLAIGDRKTFGEIASLGRKALNR